MPALMDCSILAASPAGSKRCLVVSLRPCVHFTVSVPPCNEPRRHCSPMFYTICTTPASSFRQAVCEHTRLDSVSLLQGSESCPHRIRPTADPRLHKVTPLLHRRPSQSRAFIAAFGASLDGPSGTAVCCYMLLRCNYRLSTSDHKVQAISLAHVDCDRWTPRQVSRASKNWTASSCTITKCCSQ